MIIITHDIPSGKCLIGSSFTFQYNHQSNPSEKSYLDKKKKKKADNEDLTKILQELYEMTCTKKQRERLKKSYGSFKTNLVQYI